MEKYKNHLMLVKWEFFCKSLRVFLAVCCTGRVYYSVVITERITDIPTTYSPPREGLERGKEGPFKGGWVKAPLPTSDRDTYYCILYAVYLLPTIQYVVPITTTWKSQACKGHLKKRGWGKEMMWLFAKQSAFTCYTFFLCFKRFSASCARSIRLRILTVRYMCHVL